MHIFYTPDISSNEYILTEEESKHCTRVLRLKTQDIVYLVDGIGGFYSARIIDDNPKKCKVSVYHTEKEYGKRNYKLTMAVAPTKNIERFEWFLEKATEIGVDRIIPFYSQQSERKIIKADRLNKIIESAMKQSKSAYHPVLENIISFNELISKDFKGIKLIAHCLEGEKVLLKNAVNKNNDIIILIGPEGDFNIDEIRKAKLKEYTEISLGNNRLRTETAGIVACHTILLINQ